MTSMWGNDRHGPGGDPSWLGGKDREPGGAADRDRGDADVGAPYSDFGAPGQPRPEEQWAPRFGESVGDDAMPQEQDRGGWTESFGDDPADEPRQAKGIAGQVLGVLSSLLGLGVFAVVFWRIGFDQWWIILFVGIPLLQRTVRRIRKNLRG